MGVSGSGKTTVGAALAKREGWDFLDADDFHPAENVAKMAAGTPLTDADRWPWLDGLNEALKTRAEKGADVALACSALKESYRTRLIRDLPSTLLVFLHAEFAAIEARVTTRKHKYMPASLLRSQFETLEPPSETLGEARRKVLKIDATLAIDEAVKRIAAEASQRSA